MSAHTQVPRGMTLIPIATLGKMHDRIARLEAVEGELLAALLQCARMAEALKKECGMDPESPQAIRNGQYMAISYAARAAIAKAESERVTPRVDAAHEKGEPVPLTDEEVISLLDSNGIQCEPETAFAIVEIVERAHGIDLYASRGVQSPKPATE